MEKPYKTILEPAEDEFVEKKSRFIAYTSPVHTVEEANAFIAGIRQRHWDATHNVPAFVLRSGVQRSSDDGEPGGTAGMPVLDVLLKSGVQDVCVVVTRYFGGILLGAGGLVRAYSHACSLALEAAGVETEFVHIGTKAIRGCIGCGKCQKTCSFDAITLQNNLAYIDADKCRLCRKCVEECPTGAILQVNFPARPAPSGTEIKASTSAPSV